MKHLQDFKQYNEQKVGDEGTGLDIKNEYTKLINGPKDGTIDLGKVIQVPDASLYNIKQTYKNAIIREIDGHYILSLKQ